MVTMFKMNGLKRALGVGALGLANTILVLGRPKPRRASMSVSVWAYLPSLYSTRGGTSSRGNLATTREARQSPSKHQTGIGRCLRQALVPSDSSHGECDGEVSQPARGSVMKTAPGRRFALMTMGLGMAAGAAGLAALQDGAARAAEPSLEPPGAKSLQELTARLSRAPRRRDFKTVPMILNDPDHWDDAALSEVIAYRGAPKQVWDNIGIASPWLNVMRNALNAQVWSFRHPDFLVVSATHGTAHLALFGPAMWEKYQLAKLTGGKFQSNTLIAEQKGTAADPTDYENPEGAFSPHDNFIPALQRRGVVFLACHNAIWEIAERLIATEANPDELPHDALAAELTNHLIAGVVLTPGMGGTLPELQLGGFNYANSG
jgi:hypothetical protein